MKATASASALEAVYAIVANVPELGDQGFEVALYSCPKWHQ